MHRGQGSNPNSGGYEVIDQTILATLDEHLFSSVQDLVQRTCILLTTIWRRPALSLDFVVKHLHWVPHNLIDAQLAARVQL
jgi:hypothetical protein